MDSFDEQVAIKQEMYSKHSRNTDSFTGDEEDVQRIKDDASETSSVNSTEKPGVQRESQKHLSESTNRLSKV